MEHHPLLCEGTEYMKTYATSVRTYRGRTHNGVMIGLIEPSTTDIVECIQCDPADSSSSRREINKPNHVLFPDTSYKIAQFINECNVEKTPVVIVANWRGFSGGTNDMYHSVLKYGSMIVDAIAHFEHSITVYVPPGGQLILFIHGRLLERFSFDVA